jgi:hypothetical protein
MLVERVARGLLLAGVRGAVGASGWRAIGLALRDSRPTVCHQALHFVVLAMQIGNLVPERVTRRLPLLLLRDVCDRRALLLKLQLLLELRDQSLKFLMQFAVLTL